MNVDFKNYNKPGILPEHFEITDKIISGNFPIILKYDNPDDEGPFEYTMTFKYRFDFVFRKTVSGTVYVYGGGFYIYYKKPFAHVYKSSHCNHFSMPMCQHYTTEGYFTQFFIDRLTKELNYQTERLNIDSVGAITRYANLRKGGQRG